MRTQQLILLSSSNAGKLPTFTIFRVPLSLSLSLIFHFCFIPSYHLHELELQYLYFSFSKSLFTWICKYRWSLQNGYSKFYTKKTFLYEFITVSKCCILTCILLMKLEVASKMLYHNVLRLGIYWSMCIYLLRLNYLKYTNYPT